MKIVNIRIELDEGDHSQMFCVRVNALLMKLLEHEEFKTGSIESGWELIETKPFYPSSKVIVTYENVDTWVDTKDEGI